MSENPDSIPQSGNEYALQFEPKFMDSLDARILQYKYALVKLGRLIKAIDEFLGEASSSPENLVLMHYIIYLASNLFAINESGFFSKLEALENFKVLRSASIATSQIVTHIPYDMRDQAIVPLDDLPATASSIACLKAFRTLCITCQDAYQKRFANASNERKNEKYLEDLEYLFTKVFFDLEKDFDMVLKSSLFEKSSLVFQLDTQMSVLGDYSEASLIDIDVCSLFTIVSETSKMIASQKPAIIKYKTIKQAPKNVQEGQLKEIPYNTYALHRVFFWALRINELYFMLRKYGRQIFISNHDHLHDQKFFSFVSNGTHYRDMLREIEENFFNAKKNGVLIATITRFLRMDSNHEISSKTIFDFVGFIHQSMVYIEGLLAVLKEFGYAWLSAEIGFRTSHDLPVDHLLKVNDIVEGEKVKDLKAKRLRAQLLAKQKAKQNPTPTVKPRPVRPAAVANPPKPTGIKSPPTVSKSTRAEQDTKTRTDSLINKPADPRSPFYLQRQSSTSSLQSTASASSMMEKKAADSPTSGGRRRSSSQPISYNAAATALKGNGVSTPVKLGPYALSPSGSIRRASLITKKTLQSPAAASPLNNKRPVMDVVEEKKEASPPNIEVRKTASQKFQEHLLEASRSGTLYSKEKEVFSNVVFDPNNPSATNLRRQTKPPAQIPQEISPSRGDTSPSKSNFSLNGEVSPSRTITVPPQTATATQKPTRDQITRRNTRSNSVVVQSDTQSRVSDSSRNSTISTLSQSSPAAESIIIKKVRFTGVPEYTPAEDAPSSQKNVILKSFAALKIPAVKRKEEAFKREESQLFKQYLNHDEPSALPSNAGIYAPGNQITLKFSRFKNRF